LTRAIAPAQSIVASVRDSEPREGVLAIAVVNEHALWSARQVNMSAERIRDLAIAFSIVAIPVGPAGIVIAIRSVPV
jgi:hypothetical protein